MLKKKIGLLVGNIVMILTLLIWQFKNKTVIGVDLLLLAKSLVSHMTPIMGAMLCFGWFNYTNQERNDSGVDWYNDEDDFCSKGKKKIMKITINIPKEFEEQFNSDRFQYSLLRLCCGLAGDYETKTAIMLIHALEYAEVESDWGEEE